ncbi:uncharacterized protein LOC133926996 [Phragmites australis]|uniref:uncharacterized protein LOC133926996 n=1 Tax=Phragmites australis TaxID=29695 RepID=UPI002D79CBA8|nr:uncharacterized protein LOC133926996 [Phragmites australis]
MLLRSASSPLPGCARAPAEHGGVGAGHLALVSPSPSPSAPPRQGALCRAMSDGDLALAGPLTPAVGGKKVDGHVYDRIPPLSASTSASISVQEEEKEGEEGSLAEAAVLLGRLLTSTVLHAPTGAAAAVAFVEEGVGGGGGGRKACGSGRQDGGDDGNSRSATDAHYRRIIESNPGNSLLLGNYARFLKEVEGDAARAQEYCERAILANPSGAEALALYAELVWETSRDAGRADAYYSRAVQAAPNDCYVLGSYAGFLWDAEEDDEENDSAEPLPPPSPFLGAAQPPSITAASQVNSRPHRL